MKFYWVTQLWNGHEIFLYSFLQYLADMMKEKYLFTISNFLIQLDFLGITMSY